MRARAGMALVAGTSVFLGACFDGSGNGNKRFTSGPEPALNVAPTISGSPPRTILEGQFYEFTPNASDANGDALRFSIRRKPAWATFDPATGRLAGTPGAGDVGNFTNIRITVSDGWAWASLGDFHITVDQFALGSATLSWNPPTENADGSPLTNLAGYRIYYGRDKDYLTHSIDVDNPGLTRYMIENLSPARWHFALTSVNSAGQESRRTETVSKIVG